jgi:hypothetical protein
MQAKSKGSVIEMHVAIGQAGMQQGLAFNPSVLLFKSFLIFDGSELHERIGLYAPHKDIQAYNTNKLETIHQSSQTETKATEN